ncbi:fimbrial biogenesis chaperone [Sphingomonas hankyongi]|uniref:Molecular chaperone n=1 Tax=Sphingomonas hankyongi TaxID=2908209 RepID=A0ABT0S4X3_9SPHN|nr:molecular chaperone [Sphingomonas hankyongi]MCL6730900.1 molecular chaperone [Sphingomonas hankyongi]
MNLWTRTTMALAFAVPLLASPTPASAGVGDLLVAPTRIILDGRKGTEIILNNIGEEPATYRVSVEFRRMLEDGSLEDVKDPSAAEKLAEEMIVYAPRRVTLAPREPQAIRIAARAPQGIQDGEYRIHLLFRAVPPPEPVVAEAAAKQVKGVSFQLRPIYGVTIPVIVRLGNLQATAGISDVQIDKSATGRAISLELSRNGTRSTFGEVRVLKPGVKEPIALQRAVAIYTEVGKRRVIVPVDDRFKGELAGPVTVQYAETYDDGSRVIAETQAVLR